MSAWEIAAAIFASFVTTAGYALGYHRGNRHGFDDGRSRHCRLSPGPGSNRTGRFERRD
jgi:hypothetical protein